MEEDGIVQIYLGALVKKYGPIHMAIYLHEREAHVLFHLVVDAPCRGEPLA